MPGPATRDYTPKRRLVCHVRLPNRPWIFPFSCAGDPGYRVSPTSTWCHPNRGNSNRWVRIGSYSARERI